MNERIIEIIASTEVEDSECGSWMAERIVKRLNAAGFVIAPKEPTEEMVNAGKGPSSQFVDASSSEGGPRAWELEPEQLAAIYRAMITATSQDK